jgi:hypothetical protein
MKSMQQFLLTTDALKKSSNLHCYNNCEKVIKQSTFKTKKFS